MKVSFTSTYNYQFKNHTPNFLQLSAFPELNINRLVCIFLVFEILDGRKAGFMLKS